MFAVNNLREDRLKLSREILSLLAFLMGSPLYVPKLVGPLSQLDPAQAATTPQPPSQDLPHTD